MKSLILALCLLGFSPAFAGPGDGAVFPWPTGIEKNELLSEDIQGEWIAYAKNAVYFVIFEASAETPYRVSVQVKTKGQPTRQGLIYWGRHVFWGHISMDGERYTRMVLFREKGLGVRIENVDQDGYFDLRLERAPWNIK